VLPRSPPRGRCAANPCQTEVISGIRSIAAPGHTPGHTAFVAASGKEQLMVLSDTTNMPALFAKHPNWHGQVDADPV
jgi:glyoxylase-like metal-dependent hydrolase (beta-lactamase superfamily II)